MTVSALKRLKHSALLAIDVPDHLDALVDTGDESGGETAEALWALALDLYRTGVYPGLQLCIYHRGEVVLDRAVGHASGQVPGQPLAASARPMRTDTPINLFSAGKAITSMVMHQLEGEGILNLNKPVAYYVPGFARHGKERITLHQILDHRAGIPMLPPEALDLDILGDAAAVEEFVLDLKPSGKTGGGPAYHTISGGFVMEVVARHVLGSSLRKVLSDRFKRPLALRWMDYGVRAADVRRVAQNVHTGLRLTPVVARLLQRALGMRLEQAVEMSNDPRFLRGVIPSANVIATARDTATVYQCLLDGGARNGQQVFPPSTVAKITHVPNTHLEIDRTLGMPMRYGNGFMMGTHLISLYGWNHPQAFGHVGLTNTFTWANPERDLAVALLTTGKPVLGPHLVALPRLISAIHNSFPTHQRSHRG
ncbi:MAG: serine hydrolase domain-containing protein [Halioglobus sp.]